MFERLIIVGLFAVALVASAVLGDDRAKSGVSKREYGKTSDGQVVAEYTLTAGSTSVKLLTYGATISQFLTPDQLGRPTDVVLGFDDMAGWQSKGNPYFGCIVGRVANRVANGKFTLNGREYKLAVNNGPNSLHGGTRGFDKVVWKGEEVRGDAPSVRFTYRSLDGEEGYPGNLVTKVVYSLSQSGALMIEYEATTDQPTPVNLTNHAYFNLNGAKTGSTILNHLLTIAAKKYTPADDNLIPTGQMSLVLDTPLDFTKSTEIGARIKEIKATPVGYDHNYVLDSGGRQLALAARAASPQTGITLEVQTTEPGLQLYTGNFLDGTVKGKGGVVYPQYGAFCLEAQHFPDAVNHPEFPSVILQPGKTYRQTTVYRVSAK
jgi:aldose 1-epimerase